MEQRWVFTFSVTGDLRFISHRDTLRLLQRALARADLPVRFSEGYNPHPRIAIPLPRPVGVASDDEAVVIEFERLIDGQDALRRLQEQCPAGVRLTTAWRLEPAEKLQPDLVSYRLEIGEAPPADLQDRIRRIWESEVIHVQRICDRERTKRSVIDVRRYLVDLRLIGDAVEFTLRVTTSGTARPAEIAALLGYDVGSVNHRIRRLEVRWKPIE